MNTKRRYENPPLARLNKQRLTGAVALLLLLPGCQGRGRRDQLH